MAEVSASTRSALLDKPLSEIIDLKRKEARADKPERKRKPAQPRKEKEARREPRKKQAKREPRGDVFRLLVSRLPRHCDEKDLSEIFEPEGAFKSILYYTKDGKSRGEALVLFRDASDARRTQKEFDGAEVDSRIISVQVVGSLKAESRVKVVKK